MEAMERFELAIVVLLVVLVLICVYIAASWTIWRRSKKKSPVEEWLDKNEASSSAFRKGFVPEGEEGLPKITITPVQPRPDISETSAPATDTEDEVERYEPTQEIDLGRLYFALKYDHTRSFLCVRLIRGEDIPMERDISATYVGVRLLPLRLHGQYVQPYETSINVSFQECYEFPLPESELAHQTLDFHICRYDRFSRKVAIGDVYLALAELGAQGIDITKEVYLCRNLIHSKEGYMSEEEREDEEYDSDGKQRHPSPKVARSRLFKAKSMWKIVQAAVLKGKFHGISQSYGLAGQDSPFYWESMFSSGEGENTETSPGKVGPLFYRSTLPDQEQDQEEDEDDDEINVDEVVRKGERSGSFLFPSQQSDDENKEEDEEVEAEAEAEPLPSPLQISPAPEEYYRLVPFTPYTPTSPVKKPNNANVSWRVPESFSSRGPDVVQALSDIYTDPRIVTTANLRQTKPSSRTKSAGGNSRGKSESGHSSQATLPDSAAVLLEDSGQSPRTKKRKHNETKKYASVDQRGTRKVVKHRRKRSGQHNEPNRSRSETQKRVPKTKTHQKTRSMSTSSDEEPERQSKKKIQKQRVSKDLRTNSKHHEGLKETMSLPCEQDLVFEAKDFTGSCGYPLKNRAQSAPDVLDEELQRTYINRTRPSVSMSDVKDSHIDSSDVSSDFEQD